MCRQLSSDRIILTVDLGKRFSISFQEANLLVLVSRKFLSARGL